MIFEWTVTAEEEGLAAKDILKRRFGCSATLIKAIRLHGRLTVNGAFCRMKEALHCGDHCLATPPAEADEKVIEIPPELDCIYRDPWLLVINKAPGWTVHPSLNPKTPSLCAALSASAHLHPVNRLDADTSGLCLIATWGHCHQLLTHTPIEKTYLALVHGRPREVEGLIDRPIERDPTSIILRQLAAPGAGKAARSHYWLLEHFPKANCSLLAFRLLTGRTHQIRVHALSMGHPLLGDPFYNLALLREAYQDPHVLAAEARSDVEAFLPQANDALDRAIGRQALHAAELRLRCPYDGLERHFKAPLPADMAAILAQIQEGPDSRPALP